MDFDEIVTCLTVVQEVLQEIKEERPFHITRESMRTLPTLDDPLDFEVVNAAVDFYRAARRAELTVQSSIDCLIAATALRHDLGVLHYDRDFAALAKVSPLRQRAVRG